LTQDMLAGLRRSDALVTMAFVRRRNVHRVHFWIGKKFVEVRIRPLQTKRGGPFRAALLARAEYGDRLAVRVIVDRRAKPFLGDIAGSEKSPSDSLFRSQCHLLCFSVSPTYPTRQLHFIRLAPQQQDNKPLIDSSSLAPLL